MKKGIKCDVIILKGQPWKTILKKKIRFLKLHFCFLTNIIKPCFQENGSKHRCHNKFFKMSFSYTPWFFWINCETPSDQHYTWLYLFGLVSKNWVPVWLYVSIPMYSWTFCRYSTILPREWKTKNRTPFDRRIILYGGQNSSKTFIRSHFYSSTICFFSNWE